LLGLGGLGWAVSRPGGGLGLAGWWS